jgi:creatinine amidohydrolase
MRGGGGGGEGGAGVGGGAGAAGRGGMFRRWGALTSDQVGEAARAGSGSGDVSGAGSGSGSGAVSGDVPGDVSGAGSGALSGDASSALSGDASGAVAGAEAGAGAGAVVVLPLGAVEQHGPHLPLSTDLDLVLGVLEAAELVAAGGRVPGSAPPPFPPVLLLPPLAVGSSLEHAGYPGTLSLSARLLEEVVVELGQSVARAGFRRLLLLNGHGGNHALLQDAALRLRAEAGLLVVNLHYLRLGRPHGTGLPEAEWRHGLHAGAVETAMMLHLHPERVREVPRRGAEEGHEPAHELGRELAEGGSLVGPAGAVPFAWLAQDLSETGITGDPRLATAEMGATLVAHYGGEVARVLRDMAAFPLARLRSAP